MADPSDSDSDGGNRTPVKPLHKRRRILDASAVTTVPIYSNKVNSSLRLNVSPFNPGEARAEDKEDPKLSPDSHSPTKKNNYSLINISDLDKEPDAYQQNEKLHSPSPPPPPCSPSVKTTRRANSKIQEINKRINAIDSLLSPGCDQKRITRETDDDDDDDVIVVSDSLREISLKFRCRNELYKIPVQSTAPLSRAVEQLSVKLNISPQHILLLRKDKELAVECTSNELGLSIADIIDCVVIAETSTEKDEGTITVRLQGKDKGSSQDFAVHKESPLGSVFSQYRSKMAAKAKVRFLFDGSHVNDSQTPSQLEMEDGDVIEVWA